MMFSLQILFSIIACAVFATEENFNSSNSILRENKRLTDQTVKTVVSSSLLSCSQACLRRSWCTSTNFNSLKKSNEGNCELNKHKFSPITDDSKLTDEPGTTFTMLLKGCLMSGCLNGGSCSFDEKEGFACSCKPPWSGKKCEREPIDVRMMSAGFDDIRGGNSSITIDGLEVSPNKRGHNVVAVDQEGNVIGARNFDTHEDSSAGKNMANFIESLPTHTVVLIAVKDSGEKFVDDAANALKSLGATNPLKPGFRGSWLLVGYKGNGEKPSWIRQEQQARSFGPCYITVRVFEGKGAR